MSLTEYLRLYLVTDSSMVPEGLSFEEQVEKALVGGATCVQLREKKLLTRDFIERAKAVHQKCRAKGVPLIINDRIDVALAIDAEGVHVGQDDMPAKKAREILGEKKIIGVSCSTVSEIEEVCKEGIADYVGLGNVYQTSTKKDVKTPNGIGPIGVRKMLHVLRHNSEKYIGSVAIGGINHSNSSKLMYQTAINGRSLDGVAIVSCIMASRDAEAATRKLSECLSTRATWTSEISNELITTDLDKQVKHLVSNKPLIHHITNNVVKNYSANVALSIGASPIMSEFPEEFKDFTTNIKNLSLVLNLGTPSVDQMHIFKRALYVYNEDGKHIIFDPVAAGATGPRLESCLDLLNSGQFSVIKGNLGEIAAIWSLCSNYKNMDAQNGVLMHGVDSVTTLSKDAIVKIGTEVALDFRTVVVITGATNYIFDGFSTYKDTDYHFSNIDTVQYTTVPGGHELMGSITGTGCSLGTTIAAFVASKADGRAQKSVNVYQATVAAVTLYNKCGKAAGNESKSPGTFMTKFLDHLYLETHKQ